MYITSTTVTQMVTASYAVPQSSLVTICKELAKAKQMNQQPRKSIKQITPKQSPSVQLPVTKLTTTLKAVTIKAFAIGKKTVQFSHKTAPSSPI